ncbi:MAG: acylneuraminate cytidylyltransferase [Rhodoglobus sp.]|nr:acylneuraminate cytidylyltransferase [Rhodoglobus sp.]
MILGILQGRVSSARLPGKVLAPLLGEPMIVRQLERLARSQQLDRIVVATSVDPSDDPLVEALEPRGFTVRRGALDDVVARFDVIVREFAPTTIVRLTADCPLTDVAVIDRVIGAHLGTGSDYTSNVIEPTYPDGLDVEAISADAWRRLMALPLTAREREHVTLGLYGRPDSFFLTSITQQPDRSALRWTVDIPDDLDFVRTVYDALYDRDPAFDQAAVLAFLEAHAGVGRTNEDLARNAGSALSGEEI